MPEGVAAAAGGAPGRAVHDDQGRPPEPGPDAPRGWLWDRRTGAWAPRKRGAVLWTGPEGTAAQAGAGDGQADAGDGQADAGDPAPGWQAPGAGRRRLRPGDVPAEVRGDMAGFAGMVGAPLLALLQASDPYCGSVLAENYESIVDATLPLLCRSERVVRFFTAEDSDWLLWGKLMLALRPVAMAAAQHHLFRTVQVTRDADTGAVQVTRKGDESPYADHLVPPMPPAAEYAA